MEEVGTFVLNFLGKLGCDEEGLGRAQRSASSQDATESCTPPASKKESKKAQCSFFKECEAFLNNTMRLDSEKTIKLFAALKKDLVESGCKELPAFAPFRLLITNERFRVLMKGRFPNELLEKLDDSDKETALFLCEPRFYNAVRWMLSKEGTSSEPPRNLKSLVRGMDFEKKSSAKSVSKGYEEFLLDQWEHLVSQMAHVYEDNDKFYDRFSEELSFSAESEDEEDESKHWATYPPNYWPFTEEDREDWELERPKSLTNVLKTHPGFGQFEGWKQWVLSRFEKVIPEFVELRNRERCDRFVLPSELEADLKLATNERKRRERALQRQGQESPYAQVATKEKPVSFEEMLEYSGQGALTKEEEGIFLEKMCQEQIQDRDGLIELLRFELLDVVINDRNNCNKHVYDYFVQTLGLPRNTSRKLVNYVACYVVPTEEPPKKEKPPVKRGQRPMAPNYSST